MKNQLSSLEVSAWIGEMKKTILEDSPRIEKVYQIDKSTLEIRVHSRNMGQKSMILAKNYACFSSYRRHAPDTPSPFAMQLRKNLSGRFIRDIKQHGFDRIVELEIGDKVLICELFAEGNIILCDNGRKIIGLLRREEWGSRTLSVGMEYCAPPSGPSPADMSYDKFEEILAGSEKDIVRTLAVSLGLGRIIAEEICTVSGIEKSRSAGELDRDAAKRVFDILSDIADRIRSVRLNPEIIYSGGTKIDVTPVDLKIYEGYEKKPFPSFNEAVDEYFIDLVVDGIEEKKREAIEKRIEDIERIEKKQYEVIEDVRKKSQDYKAIGDYIYSNYAPLEEVVKYIKEMRKKGADDKTILAGLKERAGFVADLKGRELFIEV